MLVTVQVKVSVASTGAVADGDDRVGAAGGGVRLRVPLIDAGGGVDAMPGRQPGGGVGQRVAVGIGGVGVEADQVTLGVGAVAQVLVLKVGCWLVLVTVQLKVSVASTAARRGR